MSSIFSGYGRVRDNNIALSLFASEGNSNAALLATTPVIEATSST